MQNLEKQDIQGLVARGYGKLPKAKFLLLSVADAVFAKKFLNDISDTVNTISISPVDFAVNVAFTAAGLKALGLSDGILEKFSREFLEGMNDSYRSFLLGDEGNSHPDKWKWGGANTPGVHVLLLLYAKDDNTLTDIYRYQVENADFRKGLLIFSEKNTTTLKDNKEHFGFKDGITQPMMEGLTSADNLERFRVAERKVETGEDPPLMPGEFVLGYRNEYNSYTESPELHASYDPKNMLPPSENDPLKKDLGRNGTYLVYREIEQDVLQFWNYLAGNADTGKESKEAAAIRLGAKMVGRWPDGTPVTLSPLSEDDTLDKKSKFTYYDKDHNGEQCPIGAHIRRTNPRDQLFGKGKDTSVEVIRKHQVLRRGRAFGKPVAASMKPEDIMKVINDDGEKRGLHFICLNASLSRQFEFIQSIWVKSSKFGGLYNDADPLLGGRSGTNNKFTCPVKDTASAKYKNIPSFTTVVGGAYFFLPGIKALKFIAQG